MIPDPVFYFTALCAVTALGLSKGGFAGLGMVAMPLLCLVIPPLQAAGILLPIMIVQDAVSMWAFRRKWDGSLIAVMIPGVCLGMGIAWLLAAYVPTAYVQIAVGVIAVVFVLVRWLRLLDAGKPARRTIARGIFWGSVSGFTSLLALSGGPPFQAYVLPLRLDKETFVGTFTIYFGIINVMKVVPFFFLGQFSMPNLSTSLALLPFAILTNLAGVWLVRRTPGETFYKIIYVLILLVGLELIRQGATDIWRN
ncbi:MAG: sulfite exporter TauE/SafE family protein [Pseudorhodoplanes sp.]